MADMNADLMSKLYSKLSGVLSVGSSIQAPGHSFLVLANPGIFLDPELDLTRADNQYLWSNTLNPVLLPQFILQNSSVPMHSLYEQVLSGKELPLIELTPSQKQQLQNALDTVVTANGDPTPAMKNYRRYQLKYNDALTAYQEAQANSQNEGKPLPPSIQQKLQAAQQAWDTLGYRAKVNTAIATINNLQDLDPNSWWTELKSRFTKGSSQSSSGAPFGVTMTSPDYKTFFEDEGWTQISFNQQDVQNQVTSKSTQTGGGVSVGWGLWRASAEASYKKDQGYSLASSTDISISLEVRRVEVTRPWMDGSVFRSRAWRWGQGSVNELISNGADASLGETPSGVMPLLPTTLILARNLTMTASMTTEESNWVNEQISAKASFGYGPFSFGGSYNQQNGQTNIEASRSGNTLSNPAVQILGYSCEVLPRSPNPDPTLPWPSAMSLEHLPEYTEKWVRKAQELRRALNDRQQRQTVR